MIYINTGDEIQFLILVVQQTRSCQIKSSCSLAFKAVLISFFHPSVHLPTELNISEKKYQYQHSFIY